MLTFVYKLKTSRQLSISPAIKLNTLYHYMKFNNIVTLRQQLENISQFVNIPMLVVSKYIYIPHVGNNQDIGVKQHVQQQDIMLERNKQREYE